MSSMWSLQVRSSTRVKKSKRVSWPGWYQSKNSSSFFNSVLLNSSAALKPKKKEKQKKEKGTPEVLWSRRNPHNNFTWGYKRLPHNLRQACQNLTKSSTEVQLQWSSLELKAALTKQHDFHVYMDVSLCPIWMMTMSWRKSRPRVYSSSKPNAPKLVTQKSSLINANYATSSPGLSAKFQIRDHLLTCQPKPPRWSDPFFLPSFLPSFPPKMVTHTPQNPRPSLT